MSVIRLGVTSTTQLALSAAYLDTAENTTNQCDVSLFGDNLDQAARYRGLVGGCDLLRFDLTEWFAGCHRISRHLEPPPNAPFLHAGPIPGQLELNFHASTGS